MHRMGSDWREFWNRPHRIYVNDRHRAVHYARVADDILASLPPEPARVLDYGCGEALDAARIAAACHELILCDAAPTVRQGLADRLGDLSNVRVVAPEDAVALPEGSLDLVVVNSVVQYLTPDECRTLFARLRDRLADSGRLVVADVIPPDAGIAGDVAALLATGGRHGFLFAALAGLAATFVSDYRQLRRSVGLSTWSEAGFLDLLSGCGYAATRRETNFGFNPRRMTFVARPRR
jgi:SAM-dependent methyltransferase